MAGTHNSGRRRKPAIIRKAEGKRGHSRPVIPEPEPSGQPKLPLHLGADERVIWSRVMAMMPKGVITAVDEAILEAYCSAVVTWRQADSMIRSSGLMVRGAEGQPTQNPLLRVRNRAFGEMRAAAIELGLSPAARTRLQKAEVNEDDPMEMLLGMNADSYAAPWSGRRQ